MIKVKDKLNNLRLVQDEFYHPGLFYYPKDRAKVVHSLRDCESVSQNDLRYLCFDILIFRLWDYEFEYRK